jgi:hypothetical protein
MEVALELCAGSPRSQRNLDPVFPLGVGVSGDGGVVEHRVVDDDRHDGEPRTLRVGDPTLHDAGAG